MNKKNESENLGNILSTKLLNDINKKITPNMETCKIIDNANIPPLSKNSSVECYICSVIFNTGSPELVQLKCSHAFCHECIMDWYIQCEKNKKSGKNSMHECPYCRQDGGFLPLAPNETPIKNIHAEYKNSVNNKYNNYNKYYHQVCGAPFVTKSGTCDNSGKSIYGYYCGHHKKYQTIFPKTLVDNKWVVVPENSQSTETIENNNEPTTYTPSTSAPSTSAPSTSTPSTSAPSTSAPSTSAPSTSMSVNEPTNEPDLIPDVVMEDIAEQPVHHSANLFYTHISKNQKTTAVYSVQDKANDISKIMNDLKENKIELSKLIESVKNKSSIKNKIMNTEDSNTVDSNNNLSSEA